MRRISTTSKEKKKSARDAKKKQQKYTPHHEKVIRFSFHQLVPIPDEIMEQQYDPAGYDAEVRLWGCKWGASETKLAQRKPGRADYMFDTPWSPPETFLETLSKQMPSLTFALSYGEENPTRGRFVFKKGKRSNATDDAWWSKKDEKEYERLSKGRHDDDSYSEFIDAWRDSTSMSMMRGSTKTRARRNESGGGARRTDATAAR